MSRLQNQAALRAEENRSLRPSQQVNAKGGRGQLCSSAASIRGQAAIGACPDGDRCTSSARPQSMAPRSGDMTAGKSRAMVIMFRSRYCSPRLLGLMQREEEREMFGLLADQGVGSIPWSPLAKGRLARPWGEQTTRSDTDDVARWVLPNDDKPIADAVQQAAEQHGVPMAQIALAWVLRNPVVSAPIVGATKQQHLTDAAATRSESFGR